jgi:hypothetical protein
MTALTQELKQAIARAYRVFPAAHLTPPIGVCNCGVCVSLEDERAMVETPREELSARLIREFNNSAHGRNDDLFRHFLPRIFELFAIGEEIEILDSAGFRGLAPGNEKVANYRAAWPTKQVAAVDAYFAALFARARGAPPSWPEAGFSDAFEMAGRIAASGGDLRPLLADWDADASSAATLGLASFTAHVADLVLRRCGRLEDATLGGAWEHAPEMQSVLLDWLRDPRRAARFDAAMNGEADETAFALLAWARGAFAA